MNKPLQRSRGVRPRRGPQGHCTHNVPINHLQRSRGPETPESFILSVSSLSSVWALQRSWGRVASPSPRGNVGPVGLDHASMVSRP
jgi:hypothetical protein